MPRYTIVVISIAATLWLLIQARSVLQPFLIALFIWFLLQAISATWTRYVYGPKSRPTRRTRLITAVVFMVVFFLLMMMVAQNAEHLRGQLPVYEANLDRMISNTSEAVGLKSGMRVGEFVARIELSEILLRVAGTAANFISAFIVIVVYMIFISMELNAAPGKLAALVTAPGRRGEIEAVAWKINKDIEIYLGIKVILGIVQAVPTYAVLSLVGVDAASFWAIIIFFFSFIPTIGSLVGIVFPSLMALVQFDTITPFLTVVLVLAAVQLAASNWLEPQLMGKSLNLSPLVIFLAIFGGGALWGIVGALIVVPLLAVMVLVFARIPSMRPVAILLSGTGEIEIAAPGDAGADDETR